MYKAKSRDISVLFHKLYTLIVLLITNTLRSYLVKVMMTMIVIMKIKVSVVSLIPIKGSHYLLGQETLPSLLRFHERIRA